TAQRTHASQQLTMMFVATLALLTLALIDSAARTLYLAFAAESAGGASMLTVGGAIAVLVRVTRHLAMKVDPKSQPDWLRQVPWSTIGGIVGLVVFLLLAVGWATIVYGVEWYGRLPTAAALASQGRALPLAVLALFVVALVALTGRFPNFINLSSLQSFYGAR